jgi:hypothetical protein
MERKDPSQIYKVFDIDYNIEQEYRQKIKNMS